MRSDAFFRMGSTHSICQDYAVCGESEGRPYALLSDGCSGSPHTDFGARFLVRAALRQVGAMCHSHFDPGAIIADAMGMARQAELGRHSLAATLLAAVHTDSLVRTFHTGDGVVAARRRDGGLIYFNTSFGENAPYYLSYLLDEKDHATFQQFALTATTTSRVFEPGKGWLEPAETVRSLRDFPICQRNFFNKEDFDVVLLLSDGAESFFTKGGDAVPLEIVLEHLFAFKGLAGQFITRRSSAFLHKFCEHEGWKHADDFSVAGIYLGEAS
jgi:hypothetical protein